MNTCVHIMMERHNKRLKKGNESLKNATLAKVIGQ